MKRLMCALLLLSALLLCACGYILVEDHPGVTIFAPTPTPVPTEPPPSQ